MVDENLIKDFFHYKSFITKSKKVKEMKKSIIIVMLVVFVISITFTSAACKNEATTAEESSGEATEVVSEEESATEESSEEMSDKSFWDMVQDGDLDFSGQEIVINFMTGGGYDDFMMMCADEFNELTGANVVLDATPWDSQQPKLVNDITTGADRYDLFESDIDFQYNLYEYMEELTPYIEKYNVDMDGYFNFMYSYGDWSGLGRFGLPFTVGQSSIVIRTDIFDAAGISYPFDTWDDYYDAMRAVNDPENGFYGITIGGQNPNLVRYWYARLWGQGADIFTKDWVPVANSPEGVKATQMLVDLKEFAPPGMLGWNQPENAAAFLNGDAAVTEEWWMALSGLIDDPEQSNIVDKWAIVMAPGGGPSGDAIQHNIDLMKSSENKDAAFCFAAYISSTERQVEYALTEVNEGAKGFDYGRTAPWTEVLIKDNPKLQPLFDQFNVAVQAAPGLPQWMELYDAVGNYNGLALSGEATAQEAMDLFNKKLEEIIEQSKPPYDFKPYEG